MGELPNAFYVILAYAQYPVWGGFHQLHARSTAQGRMQLTTRSDLLFRVKARTREGILKGSQTTHSKSRTHEEVSVLSMLPV